MFDCHFDLLTFILMNINNPIFLKKYFLKIYNKKNITGGIFNLFYMNKVEMKNELNIKEDKINVIKNLKYVKQYIKKYNLIPKNIKYILGIEGLDYINKINDLDILYSMGLRSTNPVWNHKNKFGGGTKSNKNIGLSNLGEELIHKLIKKNIAIDLSHSNEKTFWDIISLCNKYKFTKYPPVVFASHSNSKSICNIDRNLTDKQIIALKELGGVIGLVSIKKFCIDTDNICDSKLNFKQKYLDNFIHIKNILGDIDNICVSTDDMSYYNIEAEYYKNINIFKHSCVKKDLNNLLLENNYTPSDISKIFETNFKTKILNRL